MEVFHKPAFLLLVVVFSLKTVSSNADQECDVEDGVPSVWLGDEDDAFYCTTDPSHCSHFGLDLVCENPSGGSLDPCVNGTKVLCSSPPAIPLSHPTPASEIHIVVYNIWELRYLYYQNGQRERTCRIVRELVRIRQDIDVIVFNEAFMGGCFANFNSSIDSSMLTIRDILGQYGFGYYTRTVGEDRVLPKFENGGVFIASRWPITAEAEFVYTDAVPTTADFLSAKGAKYARIVKTVDGRSSSFHIFGTHLQASKGVIADRVRVNQASEMYGLVQSLDLPKDEPVIYAGDLNANLYNEESTNAVDIFDALNATVPPIIGEYNYTTDGPTNDARDGNSQSYKDYVIYNRDHLHPTSATQEILRPRASEFFEVCMEAISPIPTYPDSDRCRESQNITDLADHFPVIGVYLYDDLLAVTTLAPTDELLSTTMTTGSGVGMMYNLSTLYISFSTVGCLVIALLMNNE